MDQVDLRCTDSGWRAAPTDRQGMLTHKVADGGQLPVFLHAHKTPVAGFKCHPPAMPFYFKHGVGRAVGEGGDFRGGGAEFGLPNPPWVPRWNRSLPSTEVPIASKSDSPCQCTFFSDWAAILTAEAVLRVPVEVMTEVTVVTRCSGTNL